MIKHRARDPLAPPPWGWAAGGAILGLLLALAVFAPARWLVSAIESVSGERVKLINARGTVWHGSAQLVLSGGPGSTDASALPGVVQWHLRPVVWGLAVQIQASCCTPQPLDLRAQLRWGGASLSVADGQSSWPAALLAGLGTPWNTVEPAGKLTITSQGLRLEVIEGRLRLGGTAKLDAIDLSSRLSTLQPLGSYRLTLQGGDVPRLELATVGGSLQLSGQGQWVGTHLRFEGRALAEPTREEALSNLLNIIGRRQGAQSIITLG